MKAVGVFPGKPNSIHLADLPDAEVDDIPEWRGVLVEALRVENNALSRCSSR
jgi:hypothetical protein